MHRTRSVVSSHSSPTGTFVLLPILGKLLNQRYRNYEHLAALWGHEGWLPDAAVQLARTHYAAYMVQRKDGLRVICLNTDMCTSTTPDMS
jgi:hypothetical protein